MKNRTGQNWTIEELESMSRAYAAHVPVPDIAKRLGRSYMAIVSRLRRMGLMDELGNRINKDERVQK